MSSIIIETPYNKISIPLYDKITVITGDSATGKTKMINLLDSIKKTYKNDTSIKANINLDSVVIVTDKYTLNLMEKTNETNKIVFIDRGNVVLDRDSIEFIHESNNIFIIMGHRNISGITSQDAILGLKHDGITYSCYQIYEYGIMNPKDIV